MHGSHGRFAPLESGPHAPHAAHPHGVPIHGSHAVRPLCSNGFNLLMCSVVQANSRAPKPAHPSALLSAVAQPPQGRVSSARVACLLCLRATAISRTEQPAGSWFFKFALAVTTVTSHAAHDSALKVLRVAAAAACPQHAHARVPLTRLANGAWQAEPNLKARSSPRSRKGGE